MYYTYIIQSDKSGRFYVGSTQDLESRLNCHNHGQNPSTKNKGPWKLVAYYEFETRAESVQYERKIKKRGIGRFMKDQAK
jgi:putative endonuclease